ncbi:hypothetical protein BJ684DRAFT_20226 [Piptocephalis cylindrospora]|uniref:CBM1 domain-containing protein n=1 Tax=Piptocephalis cylindrospora TaxID=1907219 RepID=A0A4P9Y3J4_9FUNG|nr:hypothetical protein BJ684DRAFT_20226 [Piptocephalis cylindrospora]|eukprot:RKP13264.1 hypothetical protein BJ684DRAFT_20226 [Piptocephalis cylindrospora]
MKLTSILLVSAMLAMALTVAATPTPKDENVSRDRAAAENKDAAEEGSKDDGEEGGDDPNESEDPMPYGEQNCQYGCHEGYGCTPHYSCVSKDVWNDWIKGKPEYSPM